MPEGWEEKANESKAICRTRKVGSAEEPLRVEPPRFGGKVVVRRMAEIDARGDVETPWGRGLLSRIG